MSVDKFGRHENSITRGVLRGPPGEGFHLTEDGDYDVKRKRICNVGDPIFNEHAVNLKTLRTMTLNYDHNDDKFDGKNKIIKNVALAVDDSDVVNRAFLFREINKLKQELYSKIFQHAPNSVTNQNANDNKNYYAYKVIHESGDPLPLPTFHETRHQY